MVIKVELPAGYHLNPAAPQRYRVCFETETKALTLEPRTSIGSSKIFVSAAGSVARDDKGFCKSAGATHNFLLAARTTPGPAGSRHYFFAHRSRSQMLRTLQGRLKCVRELKAIRHDLHDLRLKRERTYRAVL
jgi:hypothetical protein